MKFLCVPCDQPMTLATVAPPDRGSLSVRYACPTCGYEMAMLTNPYETQIVQSLGVRVGHGGDEAAATAAAAGGTAPTADGTGAAGAASGSRCPFAGMVEGAVAQGAGALDAGAPDDAARDDAAGGDSRTTASRPAGAGSAGAPAWTDKAAERMKAIPAFVRPMARTGIERFARERGYATIDEKVLEEARAFFGM